MTELHLDCFSGIAGDMFLGALIDLGFPLGRLQNELMPLGLSDRYEISARKVLRHGIGATDLRVEVHQLAGHRHYSEIRKRIETTSLPERVRMRSLAIFDALAEAESRVHGVSVDRVHFHEVGEVDAIVDIVGVCLGLEALKVDEVFGSEIPVGSGFVNTAHGRLPVPAPATAYLLEGMPIRPGGVESEMVTPTGAALLRGLGVQFRPPRMQVEKVGYGAGDREQDAFPNLLRVWMGEGATGVPNSLYELQCNLDDQTPEQVAFVADRIRDMGVQEVFTTPVLMKKGRAGVLLTVLVEESLVQQVESELFSEARTLGVRRHRVERTERFRSTDSIEFSDGSVRIKRSWGTDAPEVIKPEFEDCARLANRRGVPLWKIVQEVERKLEASGEGGSIDS